MNGKKKEQKGRMKNLPVDKRGEFPVWRQIPMTDRGEKKSEGRRNGGGRRVFIRWRDQPDRWEKKGAGLYEGFIAETPKIGVGGV